MSLPFFFDKLERELEYPKIVLDSQSAFRSAVKDYVLPIPKKELNDDLNRQKENGIKSLKNLVANDAYLLLKNIINELNVIFTIKPNRKTIVGNCKLIKASGIAFITVNALTNKWRMLCVVLHELSHALNHRHYSPHDEIWKSIYACLLADFYLLFPDEYKAELIWGMVYTPASANRNNFYGRAILFGIDDNTPSESYKQCALTILNKFNLGYAKANLLKKYAPSELIHKENKLNLVSTEDLSFDEELELKRWFFLPLNEVCVPHTLCMKLIKILNVMPYTESSRVWALYSKLYGDGACRYARDTMTDWIENRVQCQLGHRFFSVVPIVFSHEKQCALCKAILEFSDKVYRRARIHNHPSDFCFKVPSYKWESKKQSIYMKVHNYGVNLANTFDYDNKYKFTDGVFDAYWLNTASLTLYRKKLSFDKRKECLSVVQKAKSDIDTLSFRGEKLSVDIVFPDAEYKVTIIPAFEYIINRYLPWVAMIGFIVFLLMLK